MKILFIIILFWSFLDASIVIGKVKALVGNVKVKHETSIKKEKLRVGFEITSGDLVVSSKKGYVKIQLTDNSTIVLHERSSIHFESDKHIEQLGGKILYKITSRDAKNSLQVKTPFAIIGIKGTTFIVSAENENAYVSLKEGLIGVTSLKKEFELYKKTLNKEFKDYVANENKEFAKFKNVTYTKKFDLKEGERICFKRDDLKEHFVVEAQEIEKEFKNEFVSFENLFKDI